MVRSENKVYDEMLTITHQFVRCQDFNVTNKNIVTQTDPVLCKFDNNYK